MLVALYRRWLCLFSLLFCNPVRLYILVSALNKPAFMQWLSVFVLLDACTFMRSASESLGECAVCLLDVGWHGRACLL